MYHNSASLSLLQSTTLNVSLPLYDITHPKLHTSVKYMSDSPESVDDSYADEPSKPMTRLQSHVSTATERVVIHKNGYQLINKLCDSLQGAIFKAIQINNNSSKYVAIKKIDKYLARESIAIQDKITFCVSENIVQEAQILKHLTVTNTPIGEYIVKYIDFFESNHYFYLVTEYVESEMNLKQFVSQAKQHMVSGRLSLKHYHKMMKFIMWQLFVTVQWLHIAMKCCHLDLCLENILVQNAKFVADKHGNMRIASGICIKLCDFGVAEIFAKDISYLCCKQPLSLDNCAYSAPKVFTEDVYDAECADNWSLGNILFECMTVAQNIYEPFDIHMKKGGYSALRQNQLKKYLALTNKTRYFSVDSIDLLSRLLRFDEIKRLRGMNILRHEWFALYFKRYRKQIQKKFSKHRCGLITKYEACSRDYDD